MAQVGNQQYADGAQTPVRTGRYGELLTNYGCGEYFELAKQGRIYSASMQAGSAMGTALTATAVTWTLYNPPGSGVNLSLIQTSFALTASEVSATIAEILVYAGNFDASAAVPATNTLITSRPALFGGNAASQGKVFSATTLPAIPVVVRVFPFGLLAPAQAFATQSGTAGIAALDFVNGSIVLGSNTAVTIQGIGATGITGIFSGMWAEIPV